MADFEQLETRRLELEENVAKLRKSLQHWRTWDAEYEGLKEELSSGVNVQSEKDCVSSYTVTFQSSLLTSVRHVSVRNLEESL
jgi:unconventional prefoldin RPB5 interactor 1